jgi:DNA-binding beta-propeller fold protein YncE
MKREAFGRVRQCLGAVLLIVLAAACAQERSLGPKPVGGRVYISAGGFDPQIYVIDVETDSLIDSIPIPIDAGPPQIVCDRDVPRFAAWGGSRTYGTMFFNAGEHTPFLRADSGGSQAIRGFDASRGLLVATGGAVGVGATSPARTLIRRFPSLEVILRDTVGVNQGIVFRRQGLIAGLVDYADEYNSWVGSKLGMYDYVNHRLTKLVAVGDRPDSNSIFRLGGHPNARWFYLTVPTHAGPRLIGYDISQERELFRVPIVGLVGEPEVTPDGKEVWYPDGGVPGVILERITIYDASTGVLLDSVKFTDWRELGGAQWPVQVRFSSDGKKAYTCSGGLAGAGMFLIDVKSRSVTKAWYRPHRFPQYLDIGPSPG